MGFAWHKLIPRPIIETLQCLDYCCCDLQCMGAVCPDDIGSFADIYDQNGNLICEDGKSSPVYEAGGDRCCDGYIDYIHCTRIWDGSQWVDQCAVREIYVMCRCNSIPILVDDPNGPDRSFEGGPMTMRLNLGSVSGSEFTCRAENADSYAAKTSCDPNASREEFPRRYFETPLQAPGLTEFGYTKICARIQTYTVPDRTMIISGRNKYRYSGFLAGDSSTFSCGIPRIIDNPGASGLSQMEGSLSREFPSSDDVLANPLWGAKVATGAGADEGADPTCYPSVCYGSRCYSVVENDATGHYLSAETVGQGYFSFACFNPYADWLVSDATVGLPTCSLYSMVWAVYDATWRELANLFGYFSTEEEILGYGGSFTSTFIALRSSLSTLLATDPSQTVGGVSNVQLQLEAFEDNLQSFATAVFGFTLPFRVFKSPQVFLWDRTAYISANAADKWKHLYIPGNANILMDTGCTSTQGWKGFRAVLDEVTHDRTWGSTHSAMLIGFMGCNNQASSAQKVVVEDLGCALLPGTPLLSDGFCELCATSGSPYNMDSDTDCIPHPMNPLATWTSLYDPFCTCCT